MMLAGFSIARLPRIEFGAGKIAALPALAAGYGSRVLLVTGARSLRASRTWSDLEQKLEKAGLRWQSVTVDGEPSPHRVDQAVARHAGSNIDVVIGIGGGSVLDAAKAIAGLLRVGDSVIDYLEGVGSGKAYSGPAVPFIAVPTTAGTGSEATKNAVLSVAGKEGFKKSFRDERLVPEYALVDPDLLATCPPALIAGNGMDALTQLLESYVSLRSNPMTDALAWSGLGHGLRRAAVRYYAGADRAGVGTRTGISTRRLLPGATRCGVRNPGGRGDPCQHCCHAGARAG
jgi:alcohol dehydrogenase class IV